MDWFTQVAAVAAAVLSSFNWHMIRRGQNNHYPHLMDAIKDLEGEVMAMRVELASHRRLLDMHVSSHLGHS